MRETHSTVIGELLAVLFFSNPHSGSVLEDLTQSPILPSYEFSNRWAGCAGIGFAFQETTAEIGLYGSNGQKPSLWPLP